MEENNMNTTINKGKPGKTPSAPVKAKAPNIVSQDELKRRDKDRISRMKKRGYKLVPLKGAIIQIPEGTDIS
jgi:hypothetical protein